MSQLHEAQHHFRPIERYIAPRSFGDALAALREFGESARVIAGGTDLLLELSRGIKTHVDTLIDLSVIDGLDVISVDEDQVVLGPQVTHGQVVGLPEMRQVGLPLAQACLEVGSPQLRNRATIAGNIVTASPANDTISALYALGAEVKVASADGKHRTQPIDQFVTGFRTTSLEPTELVEAISFPPLGGNRRGIFVKLGLRKIQAISVVHAAAVVTEDSSGRVTELVLALGSVGPTVELVPEAASLAVGKPLAESAATVAAAARELVTPIDDLRSTADYRSHTVEVVVRRALTSLANHTEGSTWPDDPPPRLRVGQPPGRRAYSMSSSGACHTSDNDAVACTINGVERTAANAASRTLLDWLRFDVGLTGTKEGCAEGECGACTVHLDGQAVLACLVPAARAAGCEITTVEGIAPPDGDLHPVQEALASSCGVQCGFCTPGFVMSAAMLDQEVPNPTRDQVTHALSGNLCRCTGYYPIIDALSVQSAHDAAIGAAVAVSHLENVAVANPAVVGKEQQEVAAS